MCYDIELVNDVGLFGFMCWEEEPKLIQPRVNKKKEPAKCCELFVLMPVGSFNLLSSKEIKEDTFQQKCWSFSLIIFKWSG